MCNIDKYNLLKTEIEKDGILSLNFDKIGWDLKKKFIKFHYGKCLSCGLSEWLGKPITLEVDHIDGNNKNNDFDNLRPLCPNCHSQTLTWRGRNKTNKRLKVSNSELLNSLIENDWNMYQALLDVGLSPKGGNYKRCHKLKEEFSQFGFVGEIKVSIDVDQTLFVETFYKCNTISEIAELLGISYKRAYVYSKKYNCSFMSDEYDISEIVKMLKELRSFKAVGEFYGVSDNCIRKRLLKHNINPKEVIK